MTKKAGPEARPFLSSSETALRRFRPIESESSLAHDQGRYGSRPDSANERDHQDERNDDFGTQRQAQ
jgi:hypothetical protein